MQRCRASEVCVVLQGSPCALQVGYRLCGLPTLGISIERSLQQGSLQQGSLQESRCASDVCSKRCSLLAAGSEESWHCSQLFGSASRVCVIPKAAPAVCREDAVKLALFVGGFTGSYHLLRGGLQQWLNQSHPQACFTAGCLAGKAWGSLSGLT